MSLKQLLELKESIILEYTYGRSQGYSKYSVNRLKQLLDLYETWTSSLSEEDKKNNNLTSLNKVKELVMKVA